VWSSRYSPPRPGIEAPCGAGEEPQVVHGEVELEVDDRRRLAHVQHLEPLELVEIALDRVGQGEELLAALARGGLPPGLERRGCGGDRRVDVVGRTSMAPWRSPHPSPGWTSSVAPLRAGCHSPPM
jgi:hypothetical protein